MGPVLLGGSYERGRFPLSLVGRSAGTDTELHRLREECSNQTVGGRTERNQHRWSWTPRCTSQPELHICWCMQGLSAATWASVDRPGERAGVDCVETAGRSWRVLWAATRGVRRIDPGATIEAT